MLSVLAIRRICCLVKDLTMRELVATDRAEGAVAEILRYARIVEDWVLHDTGGENDLIAGRVVICVHSGHGHAPFVVPGGLAKLVPFLFDFEFSHLKPVTKVGGIRYSKVLVVALKSTGIHNVRIGRRIADLLVDSVNLSLQSGTTSTAGGSQAFIPS